MERTFVAIDIGGTNLRVVLSGEDGRMVGRSSAPLGEAKSPDAVVDHIDSMLGQLLEANALPDSVVASMAVGAPGVTDTERGIVIATSYLFGWREVPLRQMLEERFHIPVTIENDVNLAALGEFAFGNSSGARDFAFIAIGSGVGAGLILNGRLHRGLTWAAGEIGYMLVPGGDLTPVDRGLPGPLESIVGGEGIRQAWERRAGSFAGPGKTATEIFELASSGDALAGKILDDAARALAYAIHNIAIVLNLRRFVMGGSVGLHPVLIEAAQRHLDRRNARVRPQLMASTLGADAQLYGAIYLARQQTGALR